MGTIQQTMAAAPASTDWQHGLCGCCDMGPVKCCCNVYFSACCNLGRVAEYGFDGNCCLYCICAGWCLPCNRCNVAKQYNIDDGGSCMSCLKACCCGICTAAQLIQEVEYQKNKDSACCCSNWADRPATANQQPVPNQAPGKAADATANQA